MSYILDALRKAERERARGRVPTLATVEVYAGEERRLWPWLGGGVAALLVGLSVWYALSPPPAPPGPPPAPVAPQLVGPVEDLSPARAPEARPPAAPAPMPAEREAAPAPVAPAVRPPDAVAALPPAPPAPPAAVPAGREAREAMEKLHLNILVYSDIPAERMISIEGRQYGEGQQVHGKYLVESITPDGAVLSAGGERVLLQPRPIPFRRP
ncbi:MAG: general secretion pathway protein GspB [Candidatus Methylomirabilales bacterium]